MPLRKSSINYFVLAEWNLDTERLKILFEGERKTTVIKSSEFEINPNSKYRLK